MNNSTVPRRSSLDHPITVHNSESKKELQELDVVRLAKDIDGVPAGSIGTIVHVHVPSHVFMVEFCDEMGRATAFIDCEEAALTSYT